MTDHTKEQILILERLKASIGVQLQKIGENTDTYSDSVIDSINYALKLFSSGVSTLTLFDPTCGKLYHILIDEDGSGVKSGMFGEVRTVLSFKVLEEFDKSLALDFNYSDVHFLFKFGAHEGTTICINKMY